MIVTIVGINHKTAPIEIREKFYLNQLQQDLLLSELRQNPAIAEAFVLSTCNRIEVYCHAIHEVTVEFILKLITDIKSLPSQQALVRHFYRHEGAAVYRHLLQVVCGLDSLVLGEKQILGQVKAALERAQQRGMFLKPFNLLANLALRTGKKVRNETEIDAGGSSISWAAIMKAESIFGSLSGRSALIIGAGKMSKLAVGQMVNQGFSKLFLMNRTHENAQALAEQYKGEAVPFSDIKETLAQVDLCICSSSAPHYILDYETIEKIVDRREGRTLLFLDISMPRNIDPKIAQLKDVRLFSIDDLDSVVEANRQKREKAVLSVQRIIDEKLDEYFQRLQNPGICSESIETA